MLVASADGTYTVNARSFDSAAEGAFTLTVSTELADVSVGLPLAVAVDGITTTVVRFVSEGGAYSIVADSGSTVDTSLALVDQTGYRVDNADDLDLVLIPLSSGSHWSREPTSWCSRPTVRMQ